MTIETTGGSGRQSISAASVQRLGAATSGAEIVPSDAPIRKRRVHIYKQYLGCGIRMTFPIGQDWYLIEHDELVRIIGETTPFLDSPSWQENGAYSTPHPSKRLRAALEAYRVGGAAHGPALHR